MQAMKVDARWRLGILYAEGVAIATVDHDEGESTDGQHGRLAVVAG
jgi:hypothetical protein